MISLSINGEEKKFEKPLTVLELLQLLKIPESSGLAVAVNFSVIPRSEFASFLLKENDRVEIIRPVGGG